MNYIESERRHFDINVPASVDFIYFKWRTAVELFGTQTGGCIPAGETLKVLQKPKPTLEGTTLGTHTCHQPVVFHHYGQVTLHTLNY